MYPTSSSSCVRRMSIPAKRESNESKRIRQQKVHVNAQDSVHASVNPASSNTEDHYNQPKTPPHSVHATANRASHDAEDHCKLSKIAFLYFYIQLILVNYVDSNRWLVDFILSKVSDSSVSVYYLVEIKC